MGVGGRRFTKGTRKETKPDQTNHSLLTFPRIFFFFAQDLLSPSVTHGDSPPSPFESTSLQFMSQYFSSHKQCHYPIMTLVHSLSNILNMQPFLLIVCLLWHWNFLPDSTFRYSKSTYIIERDPTTAHLYGMTVYSFYSGWRITSDKLNNKYFGYYYYPKKKTYFAKQGSWVRKSNIVRRLRFEPHVQNFLQYFGNTKLTQLLSSLHICFEEYFQAINQRCHSREYFQFHSWSNGFTSILVRFWIEQMAP